MMHLKKVVEVGLTLFTCFVITACKQQHALQQQEGFVQVKGGRIWYQVIGSGNGTPILMLHGGPGGSSRSFYQFAALAKDHPIIVFDQLGSARSDHPTDTSLYTVDQFIEQVAAIQQALSLQDFYLYGHSWGTGLALAYYLKYPQGIKALVFNSPFFSTRVWKADADTLIGTLPDSTRAAIAFGEQHKQYNSKAYQQANEVYASHFLLRHQEQRGDPDTIFGSMNQFVYNYMWGPTEFTADGTLQHFDLLPQLSKIQVPTLLLAGEFDEARPATVKGFQQRIPQSRFAVIEGAGHMTMHDHPAKNIAAIKTFLDDLEKK